MSDPKIGLALGGGGARGFGHVPVLEALDELGLKPAAISGSSIGAIMGAARASGLTGREIRAQALDTFGNRAAALARLWELRPRRFADLVSGGLAIGQLDAERVLSIFVGEAIRPRFEDLVVPLAVLATDFYGGRQVILSRGDLRRAVAASIAIPMLFRPVVENGAVLIDGGVVNPVPVDVLPVDLDVVVAVDVIGVPEPAAARPVPSPTETIFGATQILMQEVAAARFEKRQPDILIRPPVGDFRVLDFLRAKEILEISSKLKDDFKRRLGRMIEARPAEPARLSGDAPGKRKRLGNRGT